MNKKAMTWSVIVTAIIAILVLIIIVWIFKDQLKGIADQFLSIIKQTSASSKEFSEEIKNLKP